MTDAALPTAARAPRERHMFEQTLYEISPCGALVTTLLIFVGLAATFGAVLAIDRYAPVVSTAHGWILNGGVWPALVLSVLIAVALGAQRYARNRDRAEHDMVLAIMPQCDVYDARMLDAYGRRRLALATIAGVLFGALPTLILLPSGLMAHHAGMFFWFVVVDCLVAALFARGIAMSVRGADSWARAIDESLIIDLLRVDSLSPIGRHGARNALIWFSVAAVILLFFVGSSGDAFTLGLVFLAAVMGIWIFVRPMERVHRRIQAAKRTELESIRGSIQQACAQAPHDPAAATKLQGLLAYEARIEAVREWPFDQTTAMRVAVYVFIPAIPWFGQAFAQRLIDTVAK